MIINKRGDKQFSKPPGKEEKLFLGVFRGVKSRLFYERVYYAGFGVWQTVDVSPSGALINTVSIFGTDGERMDRICVAHDGHNFGDGYTREAIKSLFSGSVDRQRFV